MAQLEELSLRQSGITEWSAPQLKVLAGGTLQTLDLSGNSLGPLCMAALATALTQPTACLSTLDISWNIHVGGALHQLAWGLVKGRSASLTSLDVAGTDVSQTDLFALAALLSFGHHSLKQLDLSQTSLVGVGGQCLLRQIDAAVAGGMEHAQGQAGSSGVASVSAQKMDAIAKNWPGRAAWTRSQHQQWHAHRLQHQLKLPGLQVILKGCRLSTAESGSTDPTNMQQLPASGATPLQLHMDLAVPIPDRYTAALLLQHEVAARSRQLTTWLTLVWKDVEYRRDGQEFEPIDIMYDGWSVGLPSKGVLQLGVTELPQAMCPWLTNQRMNTSVQRA